MTEPLTTQKILDYAISLEQRAVDLYTDMASRAKNSATKKVFLEYAEEEMGHRKKLEDVVEGDQSIGEDEIVADLKISDYSVDVTLGENPTYQDILLFAMSQEKQAFRLYTDLAARVPEPEFKELFSALAQEEAKHKLRFEVEYDDHVLTEN
ncbi:MAG: ferritin family protein [Deltaproteobacteria bacterium]|nr:ferritin family protein [Deltaproteobacteria bacterium]MBN2674092.1 ferritin family protein [Deltaproteobacteria bacterium]